MKGISTALFMALFQCRVPELVSMVENKTETNQPEEVIKKTSETMQ